MLFRSDVLTVHDAGRTDSLREMADVVPIARTDVGHAGPGADAQDVEHQLRLPVRVPIVLRDPARGDDAGDRPVGELRSAVRDPAGGWRGLAMLSKLHVTADARLALAPGGPAELGLVDVP